MEQSQLSQMVTWLDKEHQRDRVELNQLQQRVETLAGERDEQAGRITQLETELAALRAYVDRVAQVEDYFERFKREMSTMLEQSEARRQQALRDSDRVRQVEIDNVTKALSEIRKEVEKFRRYGEELAARRADTQRLSEAIARLQQQMMDADKDKDERARGLAYLEEQRRQDNKRIAELQAQTAELFKKTDLYLSKIQLLEQFPPRMGELKSSIEDVRQQQNKYLERAQFQDVQRERQMKGWNEQAELQRQRMDEYENRMERYAEQHQRIKKAMEDLQEFKEQIQRQQHETAELQRLAENRQKSQWEGWEAQEEQRWKKHTMEWDHQWSEHDKAIAELGERIAAAEKLVRDNEKRLQLLLQMLEEDTQMRAIAARDWQVRFEEIVEQE
jgi:chromosome segregation ATPase